MNATPSVAREASASHPWHAALLAGLLGACLVSLEVPAAESRSGEKPLAPGVQRERVHLILIDVVVTDRKGNRVDDLRPEEFSLWVDGHPHAIESVELQRVETVPAGPAARRVEADKRPVGAAPVFPAAFTRHFVFLFDALNSERGLGSGSIQTTRRFLQRGLPPGDEVMVAGQGRELKIYLEFTADPAKMLAALKVVESDPRIRTAGENRVQQNILALRNAKELCQGCSERMLRAALEQAAGAAARADRERILRSLAALRTVVSYLQSGTGRKELFYFTDGFPSDPGAFYGASNEPGLEPEILRLAREAAAAQVIIHTINTQGVPSGKSMANVRGLPDRPWESLIESEASDTLAALSLGTGGVASHMSNRFDAALERVENETRASYLVAYLPSGKPDGKFHSVHVKVLREGMRVRAEEGFLWMTDEENQERKIQSAYLAPELFHDLPLAMEARSYLAADDHPAVQLAFAVPDQSLLFLPREDRLTAQIDVGLTLRSDTGTIVDRFSQGVEVRLPLDGLAAHADLTLLTRRNIPPGEYDAVAVVRDQRSGEIGALRSRVKVPALVGDRIAMSSLTLSSPESRSRRVDLDPATSRDPQIVIPAVRRVFSRDEEVVGTCLVYHPRPEGALGEARVTVSGSIRKGKMIVRKLPTSRHIVTATAPTGAIPLQFFIPLADLDPGVYTLEVRAVDENAAQGIVQDVDFLVR